MPLSKRDLLSVDDLSVKDINLILDTARSFEEVSGRLIKKVPTLRGRTVVNLFLEPSTRTRTSFEIAGKRLSADVINISGSGSALSKGESLKDTAKTIEAMAVDCVVIRHWSSGSAKYLADLIEPPVINAGDGCHEHPTQALLDLYTIREQVGEIAGAKIVIVGDLIHSRVARSLIKAASKLGAKLTLAAPPTLIPPGLVEPGVTVTTDFDAALEDTDIVYLLRLQSERQKQNYVPSLREYSRLYGLTKERWLRIKDKVKVLHPGPVNRGIEIDATVADDPSSLITSQVSSGVAVRMAVLYLLLGGVDGE